MTKVRTAVLTPEVITTRTGDTRTVVVAAQGARPTKPSTRPADKRRRFAEGVSR